MKLITKELKWGEGSYSDSSDHNNEPQGYFKGIFETVKSCIRNYLFPWKQKRKTQQETSLATSFQMDLM